MHLGGLIDVSVSALYTSATNIGNFLYKGITSRFYRFCTNKATIGSGAKCWLELHLDWNMSFVGLIKQCRVSPNRLCSIKLATNSDLNGLHADVTTTPRDEAAILFICVRQKCTEVVTLTGGNCRCQFDPGVAKGQHTGRLVSGCGLHVNVTACPTLSNTLFCT